MRRAALILALAALAGGAHAQSRQADAIARFRADTAPLIALKAAAADPGAAVSLSDPALFLKAAADRDPPPRPKGTVQTALDRRFTRAGGVVGSVGYLCGLQPGPNEGGGVASSREPAGTFLGGQLHVAF